MENIKKYIISYFSLILFFYLFPLHYVSAATIGFSPVSGSYNVGDTINVKVYIGSGSQSVNAVSANIKFSKELLSLSSISKSGSIINLWAQEPSFSNSEGVASFEGVILNGYAGNSGNTATLVFKAKSAGQASVSFSTASVLANDGNGTEVLYSKGTSSLNISNAINKSEVKTTTISKKDTTIAISEIKNNISKYSPNKFLITSPQQIADKSYAIQIDSLPSVVWTDDGTHIYQAPELSNGLHVLKVMAVGVDNDQLSGSLSFYTTFLKAPIITYYPKNLFVDDFMVLKGIADPSVDIELTISNITTGGIILEHVSTNSDGKFTFVNENKIPVGTYSVTARSQTVTGITSDFMDPIQVINKERQLNFFVEKFSNYLMLITPLVALFALLIIILLYAIYRIRKLHRYLNRKLPEAESIVSKSFDILNEDTEEEKSIFQKIKLSKTLTDEDKSFLDKFKDDIKEAKKIIQKELKDIEKNNY